MTTKPPARDRSPRTAPAPRAAREKPVTTADFHRMKKHGEKIAVLTGYDYPTARLLDQAGVDGILVGDSVGMVVQGHETTLPVTLDEMIYHCRAVARARPTALVIADLPFLSYQPSVEEAIRSAGRCLKEGGARAVKLEGGRPVLPQVRALVECGIPVMGHLGLTPQSIHAFGGYRLQGTSEEARARILADARLLEEAGCFALVLETVPSALGRDVTAALDIPVIGIGAGPDVDGQVLVVHDLLGIFDAFQPKFVRRYAELATAMRDAFVRYVDDVKGGRFPSERESYDL